MQSCVFRTLLLATTCVVTSLASVSMAADHRDAPIVRLDGRTDINDIYAFRSPVNPGNSVLVLTTNPFAGQLSPLTYSQTANYDLEIYNNGDTVADVVYRSVFTAPAADGTQNVSIFRNGAIVASGAVGSDLPITGGGVARVGTFDDPFFFDLNGFNNNFNFTGDDTFAGANINAIILELPSTALNGATSNIAINSRTADAATNTQIDRMGRPAINTALIPSSLKDAFNAGTPSTDLVEFGPTVRATITSLSNPANADALTPIFLPDLLTFDTASAEGFLNGRRLTDDVIDISLNLLTAGAITTDMVNGNDRAFPGTFPYLASPNVIPEPASLALMGASTLLVLRRKR